MAYKGVNTSAKYAKQLSPFEKTLRECPLESVNVLLTLTKNTAQSPSEEKFRKIRLANSKIKQVIGDVPPALEALRSMGWVSEDVDGEPCMMLPSTVVIKFEVVRTIDEALVDVKRETEKSMRRAISARSVASNPEKEKLRLALENARKERAAADPVTKGSQAQALNFGANLMTAKDAGIGCSKGG